jgi:DNA helicase-2/ATP-dependent DNA helicase PcrA
MYPKIGNKTFIKIWSVLGKTQNPLAEFIGEKMPHNMPLAAKHGVDICIKHMKKINEIPAEEITPVKVIDLLLNKADYREYLHQNYTDATSREEDLRQLAAFSEQFSTMEEFLNELALLTNMASQDGYEEEEKGEKLVLSTIHQAKGLEWRYVFLIWCADGMLPLARALKERDGEEEERRLFYVALTRAKDELYLCCPALELSRGMGNMALAPSRFISEITPLAGEGKEKPFEQWTLCAEY